MTNTPWVIRPAIGSGWAITYRGEYDVKRIAVETREDLESLRDLLTEYLAPEQPSGPTHLAVLNVIGTDGAMGWCSLPTEIEPGGLGIDGVNKVCSEALAKFPRARSVVLVNLIPMAGA